MDDQSEDENDGETNTFTQFVADTLSKNEEKNLQQVLLEVKEQERKQVESWIRGEESLVKILV